MQEPQTKLPDPMQSKFAQVINVKWIFSLQLTIKKRSLDRFSIFFNYQADYFNARSLNAIYFTKILPCHLSYLCKSGGQHIY